MWCWPCHAPNYDVVAELFESLPLSQRERTLACRTRCALTSVNNARLFDLGSSWGASQLHEVLRRHPKANGRFDGVISQSARRRRIAAGWAESWENHFGAA